MMVDNPDGYLADLRIDELQEVYEMMPVIVAPIMAIDDIMPDTAVAMALHAATAIHATFKPHFDDFTRGREQLIKESRIPAIETD